MGIATLHSQISQVQKDILDLEKKIYVEKKMILAKEKEMAMIDRSIGKSTSPSMLKSKTDQVFRCKKTILAFQVKINDFEKKKQNKQQDLTRKKEMLRKEELSELKRHQRLSNTSVSSKTVQASRLELGTKVFNTEEDYMQKMTNKADENSGEVFVSYSWDSKEHERKVFDFVNHLRNKGFIANMDKGLSQQQTATNFFRMMYQAMHNHPKVVVILSEGYKIKADKFIGGVGTEYEWMISDINDHPNKYILASFNGRGESIIPAGFKGRDIVDLSQQDGMTALYEKLMDHKPYVFAEVAKAKPVLPVHLSQPFEEAVSVSAEPISVVPVIKETGEAGLSAGKYRFIDFILKFEFVNTSGVTMEGINYTIKLPRELDLEHYYDSDLEGYINHQRSFDRKMFPLQKVQCDGFLLKIAHQNIQKVMEAIIKVVVYTESGPIEKEFPVIELIKIKPAGEQHSESVKLSRDLFIS